MTKVAIFSTRTNFQNGYLKMWRYTLNVTPYSEVSTPVGLRCRTPVVVMCVFV